MSALIGEEARFWLYAAALGAALLFLYDILRILRRAVPHGAGLVGFEDALYWLTSGCLIFAMLYHFNNGIIRWFAVFGMLVGMLLYHLTLSRVLVTYASRALRFLLRVFARPLRAVFNKIRGFFSYMNKNRKKVTDSLKKKLKTSEKEGKMKAEKKDGGDSVGRKKARQKSTQAARQTE